jgi:hypothetical protein
MPIKPENRHRYPADWKERRAVVLERAGHRCELCGVWNHATIRRSIYCAAQWVEVYPDADMVECAGARAGKTVLPGFSEALPVRVVLTVAHLDPTYSSHDLKHLLALCQRCHLKIDAHVRHAARKAKAQ